jgi:hypothetical protein
MREIKGPIEVSADVPSEHLLGDIDENESQYL